MSPQTPQTLPPVQRFVPNYFKADQQSEKRNAQTGGYGSQFLVARAGSATGESVARTQETPPSEIESRKCAKERWRPTEPHSKWGSVLLLQAFREPFSCLQHSFEVAKQDGHQARTSEIQVEGAESQVGGIEGLVARFAVETPKPDRGCRSASGQEGDRGEDDCDALFGRAGFAGFCLADWDAALEALRRSENRSELYE
jgi:hypothetical protein